VRWHIKRDNLILLIEFSKYKRVIAAITVHNKKTMPAYYAILYILIKVLLVISCLDRPSLRHDG
jgi:hypothetical protein